MIRSKASKKTLPEIDLTGPDGNAFALLAYAKSLSSQLNLNYEQIRREMTSGDYDNLVKTFEKHFGDFVVIYI